MCGVSNTAHLCHSGTHAFPLPPLRILAVTLKRGYAQVMPSQNTRVNLTLPDDVVAVLDRISKTTGAGRATVVREWLIDALPQLGQLAQALELAAKKNTDAFAVMEKVFRELSQSTEQAHLELKSHRRKARRKKVD